MPQEDEKRNVEQWRFDCLKGAGYDTEAAIIIAAESDADLHEACHLLTDGCSVDLALEILL